MNIVWTETALNNLKAIYYYILSCSKSERTASKYHDLLVNSCLFLQTNPYAGPVEPALENLPEVYRSLVAHKHYKLIYRVLKDMQTVEIAAVWDVRRNPKALSV